MFTKFLSPKKESLTVSVPASTCFFQIGLQNTQQNINGLDL